MGLLGVPFAEAHGGFGGSMVDVMVVMQELGRGMVVEPYLSTVVIGGGLVELAGSAAQKQDILPRVAAGKGCSPRAYGEPQSRYDLHDVATMAKRDGGGFVLSGQSRWCCTARPRIRSSSRRAPPADSATGRGITLFLVDAKGRGRDPERRAHGRRLRAADVGLDGVHVGAEAVLGAVDGGYATLEAAADLGAAALCAEAVGVIEALNAATLDYLKTRQQFGQPIGRFQALQHRAVDMLIHAEQTKSMACAAAVKSQSADAVERRAGGVGGEVARRPRRPRGRQGSDADARRHGRDERAAGGALRQAPDDDRFLARRFGLAYRAVRNRDRLTGMLRRIRATAALCVALTACAPTGGDHHDHSFADAEKWARIFDDPERDTWRSPPR